MPRDTETFTQTDEPHLLRLYFDRDEAALLQTEERYGAYCYRVVYGILRDLHDAKECENDAYWKLWQTIPPSKPTCFRVFLGKIARNLALTRRNSKAQRGAKEEIPSILEELGEVAASTEGPEQEILYGELCETIAAFLRELPAEARICFVQRYWYCLSTKEIAKIHGRSDGQIRTALMRIRNELRTKLEKEGFYL